MPAQENADPYHDLKMRVLDVEDLPRAVALIALARIDQDAKFRDALTAAVDIKDPPSFRQACLALTPVVDVKKLDEGLRRRFERDDIDSQLKPLMGQRKLPLSATRILSLLNERMLQHVANLLTDEELIKHALRLTEQYVGKLVLHVLGLRRGSWNEIEWYDDKKPASSLLSKKLAEAITERVQPIVDKAVSQIELNISGEIDIQRLQQTYTNHFKRQIADKLDKWAVERSRLDADKIFNEAVAKFDTEYPQDLADNPEAAIDKMLNY